MKNFIKKNKKVIIFSSIIFVIICIAVSIFIFKQIKVSRHCSILNNFYIDFSNVESLSEKDKIFNEFVNETEGNKYNKVKKTYNDIMSNMKNDISKKIQKDINNFSSFDFNNGTKNELNNEIKALNSFLESIKNFNNSVSSNDLEKYENEINDLISSYKDKVSEIEKKEKEKLEAQKEAERKAKEEAEKSKNTNNDTSKKSKNANKNNQSNNCSKSNKNLSNEWTLDYSKPYRIVKDSDGNIVYFQDGKRWDNNGNKYTDEEWEKLVD